MPKGVSIRPLLGGGGGGGVGAKGGGSGSGLVVEEAAPLEELAAPDPAAPDPAAPVSPPGSLTLNSTAFKIFNVFFASGGNKLRKLFDGLGRFGREMHKGLEKDWIVIRIK